MDEKTRQFFNLMFRPGETVCVSHNKYGYHSIPLENALDGPVTLVPPDIKNPFEHPKPEEFIFVALNPIYGFRRDENCKAFRNFLIELDTGPLSEQIAYVKKVGMPYSAAVFSGGKSIHFLISLDQDLPSESVWRKFEDWILNVVTLADQQARNPSRSIRVPGAYREPGKKQRMVEFNGPVKLTDLVAWLSQFPDSRPKEREKRTASDCTDFGKVKQWAQDRLINGLDPAKGRNQQWFAIACEFAFAGYSEDDTLDILSRFFVPDRDFKEREWKTAVISGVKHAYNKK